MEQLYEKGYELLLLLWAIAWEMVWGRCMGQVYGVVCMGQYVWAYTWSMYNTSNNTNIYMWALIIHLPKKKKKKLVVGPWISKNAHLPFCKARYSKSSFIWRILLGSQPIRDQGTEALISDFCLIFSSPSGTPNLRTTSQAGRSETAHRPKFKYTPPTDAMMATLLTPY